MLVGVLACFARLWMHEFQAAETARLEALQLEYAAAEHAYEERIHTVESLEDESSRTRESAVHPAREFLPRFCALAGEADATPVEIWALIAAHDVASSNGLDTEATDILAALIQTAREAAAEEPGDDWGEAVLAACAESWRAKRTDSSRALLEACLERFLSSALLEEFVLDEGLRLRRDPDHWPGWEWALARLRESSPHAAVRAAALFASVDVPSRRALRGWERANGKDLVEFGPSREWPPEDHPIRASADRYLAVAEETRGTEACMRALVQAFNAGVTCGNKEHAEKALEGLLATDLSSRELGELDFYWATSLLGGRPCLALARKIIAASPHADVRFWVFYSYASLAKTLTWHEWKASMSPADWKEEGLDPENLFVSFFPRFVEHARQDGDGFGRFSALKEALEMLGALEADRRGAHSEELVEAIKTVLAAHMNSSELHHLSFNLCHRGPAALGRDYCDVVLKRISEQARHWDVRADALYHRALLVAEEFPSDEERRGQARAALLTVLARYPESYRREEAQGLLRELEQLQVGMIAPDFVASDEQGAEFRLSEYRGKVVLLKFWGLW